MREYITGVKKGWALAPKGSWGRVEKMSFLHLGFHTCGMTDILGWVTFCFAGLSCAWWDV